MINRDEKRQKFDYHFHLYIAHQLLLRLTTDESGCECESLILMPDYKLL